LYEPPLTLAHASLKRHDEDLVLTLRYSVPLNKQILTREYAFFCPDEMSEDQWRQLAAAVAKSQKRQLVTVSVS